MFKRLLLGLILAIQVACGGALSGGPHPPPPPTVFKYAVACVVKETPSLPVEGATCATEGQSVVTNQDGYGLFPGVITEGSHSLAVSKDGYTPATQPYILNADSNVFVTLVRSFPAPPTRDQVLNVHLTFQGLMVNTNQYGTLPWFEAALVSLSPADRQAVYAAKHAAGDTHCIVAFQWSYNEPGQPYANVPGADFTNNVPAFVELVREVVQAGFIPMVFLGGDNGEAGYPLAVTELPQVVQALGVLNQYTIIVPGWDGVFYGWTPDHIAAFGRQFRALNSGGYLGLEHHTGNIPVGNGPADYAPGGPMSTYDLILSEFNDGQFDDTVWQVAARFLGPNYRRPPDQPSGDDPTPPYYLKGTQIKDCAFEFGEYTFVRGQSVATIQAWRSYFQRLGYTCGG
jgi:hypothetical protein